MKRNDGFVIVGVMFVAVLFVIGFFVGMNYKKIIENETELLNLRHSAHVIEDSIRTNIAITAFNAPQGTTAVQARDNVITQITNSTLTTTTVGSYIKMAIPSTVCDNNGRACNVFVKNVKFVDNTCDLTTMASEDCTPVANMDDAKKAILEIKAEHFDRMAAGGPTVVEKSAGLKEIVVPIPQVGEINSVISVSIGSLMCPLNEPIFKGTEIVDLGRGMKEMRAKCAAVAPKSNSLLGCDASAGTTCIRKKIECDKANGFWLTKINQDLSANCERFPAGTGVSNPLITLCPAGQIATGFKLNNKFAVSDIQCRVKGGPYDFEK